ncbi:MAG: enoyl-CoA hydratase [Phenylobacterium sp.]|uniref:enoyl-CoA hydratase/isomerase family protein n=1 Tax=Phenylobacterium sp. TaxID=1871053 RepID=UPI0025FE7911|nr:enoyl-CoA hydratase-related protein [Phenylobacterium sp.]MBI1198783.1 enoyl-CoA hydratase [Phenylobacterium sp.]
MADGGQVFDAVIYERRGPVAVLTLNKPDRLNALSAVMRAEVETALAEARADDEVRALVLTGAGRGFCSGADLAGAAMMAERPAEATGQNERIDEMGWVGRWATLWATFDKPVVGAINGVAAGAGLSTAAACDVRIGSEHARFKSVFIERNLSPDSGLSWFLPRVVGYAAAADMIFTSRAVGAEEALGLGLLNRIVPAAELLDAAVAYAETIAQWPPLAMRMSKRVLQHNQDCELTEALRYESQGLAFARRAVNDAKESRLAFVEKRKGVYTGT